MNYGMIRNESNEFYHSTGAVSASTVKDFLKRPYLYFAKYVAKTVKKASSPAMELGSAAHTFILQPKLFSGEYEVLPPDFNGRTKEGKALKESILLSGKKIIEQDDIDAIIVMRDSILANPLASSLLENGEAEISWRIKTPYFDMQSRTDWFIESITESQASMLRGAGLEIKAGQPVIVDLKTTTDLDDWQVQNYGNAVFKFGYQLQLALYLAVVNQIRKSEVKEIVRHFLFLVVEKNAPNECAVVALDENSFALAQTQLKDALKRLGDCYSTGDWNSYASRGLVVCGVPSHIAERESQAMFEKKTFNQRWLSENQ